MNDKAVLPPPYPPGTRHGLAKRENLKADMTDKRDDLVIALATEIVKMMEEEVLVRIECLERLIEKEQVPGMPDPVIIKEGEER